MVLASLRQRVETGTTWPQLGAALLGFAVLASVGFADGGVLPRTWRLATLALSAIAAAALLARPRIALTRLEWATVASLTAFAGWVALSAAWSGQPSTSLLQAERSAVYAVGMLAVLLVVERAAVPHLLGGMAAGITAVCAFGLGQYLLDPPPLDPFEGRLLFEPLGYANALGIFAAIGILLAAGLALREGRVPARAAALAPLVVLVPTLLLTSSRGAWVALAAAVAVLLRVGGRTGVAALALAAAVAVAALAVVLAVSGVPDDLSELAGENRAQFWEVAWHAYLDHPLLGTGAGTYGDVWLAERGAESFTRTAHSLYVQSLAELGPVGLVLVVVALALPLARLRGVRDPLVATAAAGSAAFVLHAGIDWDWEMPAVGLAGIFCAAAVLVATRPEARPMLPSWTRAGLVAVLLGLATLALVRLQTGPDSPFGP